MDEISIFSNEMMMMMKNYKNNLIQKNIEVKTEDREEEQNMAEILIFKSCLKISLIRLRLPGYN